MIILNGIVQFVEKAYLLYGYWVIVVGIFLENTVYLGLIIPGDIIIILAGFYAQQNILSLPLVLVLSFVGTCAGDNISYLIGRYGWHKVLGIKSISRLEKMKELLGRGVWKFVFISHFSANIRVFLPTSAGISKIPYRKWLLYDTLGALLWSLSFNFLGYFAGYQEKKIESAFGRGNLIGWVFLALFLIWIITGIFSIKKLIRSKSKKL